MRNRIALVTTYLGPVPEYAQLFFASCAHNADIDFYFLCDHPPTNAPSNVKVMVVDPSAVERRILEHINININITPRKLCDYKPTYGVLFSDLLSSYEYWGYCDIDMIWGYIDRCIKPYVDSSADVISLRGDRWLSGAGTLIRNCDSNNNLFRRAPNYIGVLSNHQYLGFDETAGNWTGKPIYGGDSMFDIVSFEEGLKVEMPDLIREYHPDHKRFRISYDKGVLMDQGEVIAYHMIFAKNAPRFVIPRWTSLPPTFTIDNNGVHAHPKALRERARYGLRRTQQYARHLHRAVVTRTASSGP